MEGKQLDDYIDRYGVQLSRLALSLCRNDADAQDLYQETWLRAMRAWERYDPGRPFENWIHAICVNTFLNMQKAFSRRRQAEFRNNEEKDAFLDAVADRYADRYMERDGFLDLAAAVTRLPEKHRVLISLKYFMDYDDGSIADMLELPIGTVKSRLNRARERLIRGMRGDL